MGLGAANNALGNGRAAQFSWIQSGAALDAVVAALDSNGDGRVTNLDDPHSLTVVGYSWGAMNAAEAFDLTRDRRFSSDRAVVDKMVLIDPYKPGRAQVMIPDSVVHALIVRQDGVGRDCTTTAPRGPYVGLPPVCGQDTQCEQRLLHGIGHCRITAALDPAIASRVAGATAISGAHASPSALAVRPRTTANAPGTAP